MGILYIILGVCIGLFGLFSLAFVGDGSDISGGITLTIIILGISIALIYGGIKKLYLGLRKQADQAEPPINRTHFNKFFLSIIVILIIMTAGILIVKIFYRPVYMINDTGLFPPRHDTGAATFPNSK